MNSEDIARALREYGEQAINLGPTSLSAFAHGPTGADAGVELGLRFRRLPSGLLAPESAIRVTPLDQVFTFITVEEIFGAEPSLDYIQGHLSNSSAEEILLFVAETMAAFRAPGVEKNAVDRQFANTWFKEPYRTKILNLLAGGRRALIVPQVAFALLRLGLLCSPLHNESAEPANLPGVLLALAAKLDDGTSEDDAGLTIGLSPGRLGREVISNQHFNSEIDVTHLMARAHHRWFDDETSRNLREEYLNTTGISIEDVITVTIGLLSRSIAGHFRTPLRYFDGLEGWNEDRARAALELIAIDLGTLAELVREESEQYGIAWANGTFERFPVVILDDASVVVIDPGFLTRRTLGWLPFWDVMSVLQSGPERRRVSDFSRKIREKTEHYAAEVLTSLCGGPSRLYLDAELKAHLQLKGTKIADAVIDYGDSWVVIEITSTQLRREAVYGASDEAVEADLDKLVAESEQIEATIKSLRSNSSALTGSPAAPGRGFYPLLVMAEGFPVNPISTTLLRERLKIRGILQAPDIMPLEIVDTVELEMIESIAESGGPSLRDLLRDKQSAALWRASMRQYLIDERRLQPSRSERVDARWHAMYDHILQPLRPPDHVD